MKNSFSRRQFVQSGAATAGFVATGVVPALMGVAQASAEAIPASGKFSPLSLGLASYTFRNFTRAELIGFMKQLNLAALNVKDVKDHLPMDPRWRHRRWPTMRPRASSSTPRALFISGTIPTPRFGPNLSTARGPVLR